MSARAVIRASLATAVFACAPAEAEAAPKLPRDKKMALDWAVNQQVGKCWAPPPMVGGRLVKVQVGFGLARDGSISVEPKVDVARSEWLTDAAAAAAIRAVKQCAPYSLPPEHYGFWKKVEINFQLTPPPGAPPSASPSPQ